MFLCYKEDERTSIDSYATLRYATLYVLRYVLMLHYQRHYRTPQIDPYCTIATYTIPHEANPINSDPIQPKRLTEGSPRRDKNKQKQTKQTKEQNPPHIAPHPQGEGGRAEGKRGAVWRVGTFSTCEPITVYPPTSPTLLRSNYTRTL